jgi:hypothetical protein
MGETLMSSDQTTPRPWACDPGLEIAPLDENSDLDWSREVAAVVSGPNDAKLIIDAVKAYDAHQELAKLCIGILECLEQGDVWAKPARKHAAGLLRKALTKAGAL